MVVMPSVVATHFCSVSSQVGRVIHKASYRSTSTSSYFTPKLNQNSLPFPFQNKVISHRPQKPNLPISQGYTTGGFGVRSMVSATTAAATVAAASGVTAEAESGKKKILVLGGTGFVGSELCRQAIARGYEIVSVSRRGVPTEADQAALQVDWRKGDMIKNPEMISDILNEGGFYGVVHTIGMLLESDLNRFASGSGSIPDKDTTFDKLTRQTAQNAAKALVECGNTATSPPPFVFISAAEAGWKELWGDDPFITPDFLRRYLKAKRAVEDTLLKEYGPEGKLRPVVMRPSLIYSMDRLPSLPPVAAFYLGNYIGLPGVDRPVTVQVLASAIINALENQDTEGVQQFEKMEQLAANLV